jgi:hypothetical protein
MAAILPVGDVFSKIDPAAAQFVNRYQPGP